MNLLKGVLVKYMLVHKFSDEQAGSKAMRSFYLGRQNSWVPIEKFETENSVKKGSASPSIKCT